ncbi:UNVERIFIED_CONTAM: hypothetical protein LK11_27670 [Mumia flava]
MSLQINVDDTVPLLFRHLKKRRVAADTGIVDQDINCSKVRFRLGDELEGGCCAGHIVLDGDCFIPLTDDARFHCFCRIKVNVRNYDSCASSSQLPRDLRTDPAATTSDERHLIFQFHEIRFPHFGRASLNFLVRIQYN